MPETNAARAAEIALRAHNFFGCIDDTEGARKVAEWITAALDEAEARGLERDATWHDAERRVLEKAELAIRQCASIDGNGYFCEKAEAIAAIRALLTPSPAAQPEGER